jgi:hypothetical protein
VGIDINAFRKHRKEAKAERRSQDNTLYTFPEGTTVIYVAPPTKAMEPLPFVEVGIHYAVGPGKGKPVVCLSPDNDAVWHDLVAAILRKRKIEIDPKRGCGVCREIESDIPMAGLTDEKIDRMSIKSPARIYPMVPMFEIDDDNNRIPLPDPERIPRLVMASPVVHDTICDIIESEGDITRPDAAVLVRVRRTGTGTDTRYKVAVDSETLKTPMRIPKPIRFLVEKAVVEGGSCDPYSIVGAFAKGHDTIEKLLKGESVETRRAAEPEAGKPPCFGVDCDPDEPDCMACEFKVDCAGECGVAVPGEDEPAKPVTEKKAAPSVTETRRRVAKPEPEGDDPDPEDGEPEPEPRPAGRPVARRGAAPKPSPKPKAPEPEPDPEGDDPGDDEADPLGDFEKELDKARRDAKK